MSIQVTRMTIKKGQHKTCSGCSKILKRGAWRARDYDNDRTATLCKTCKEYHYPKSVIGRFGWIKT